MRFASILLASICLQSANGQKYFESACCEDYCYSTDKDKLFTKHSSSNSAYQIVKGFEYTQESSIPNCQPVRFWMLARHGTRLPEKEEIELLPGLLALRNEIVENYELKHLAPEKGELCPQDLELLKNWTLDANMTADKAEFLVDQGWNDLRGLAQDYKKIFPDLLGKEYKSDNFVFRNTGVQRTIASMKAFVEGLFGEGAYNGIAEPEQPQNNTLLIPMKFCPAWQADMSKVKDPNSDLDKYRKSPMVIQMLKNVSKRLGFSKILTFEQVQLIYNICAYETAWFLDKPSPWCSILTLDQVKMIEYEWDLFYHYRSGYGINLNMHIPCEIMKDMLTRLSNDSEPRVTAYFSHSTLIQMFATALGLFKDNPTLSHSNYNSMSDRKWRSSMMDPFGANYAVIKYDCTRDVLDPSPKVKFFLNQRPLQIDGCSNDYCKLQDLMNKYGKFLNADCTTLFCARPNSGKASRSSILLAVISVLNMLFGWDWE